MLAPLLIAASISATSSSVLPDDLTTREQKQLERVCLKADAEHKTRCLTREIARMRQVKTNRSAPVDANAQRDKMDIGGNHVRGYLQQQRLTRTLKLAELRRTYRQSPTQKTSEQHPDYVKWIREERLRCMTEVPVGRPRNICLDEMGNKARDLMHDPTDNPMNPTE